MRVAGTGPAFQYTRRFCVYQPEDLDEYARGRLSEKVRSTAGRANPRDPLRRRGRPKRSFATNQTAAVP